MKPLVIDCCSFQCVGLQTHYVVKVQKHTDKKDKMDRPLRPEVFLALQSVDGFMPGWSVRLWIYICIMYWLNRRFLKRHGVTQWWSELRCILWLQTSHKQAVPIPLRLSAQAGMSCQGNCMATCEWGLLKSHCQAELTTEGWAQSQELSSQIPVHKQGLHFLTLDKQGLPCLFFDIFTVMSPSLLQYLWLFSAKFWTKFYILFKKQKKGQFLKDNLWSLPIETGVIALSLVQH